MTDTSNKTESQSLTEQFNTIMTRFGEMNEISSMRVDLKAKVGQQLAVDSIKLTGVVIQTVEHQQKQIAQLINTVNQLMGASHEES